MINVGTVCQRLVHTVTKSDDLVHAAQLMRAKHIGYLVVTEPSVADGSMKPIGVLTDRDIVISVVAKSVEPTALSVGDVMTSPAITARETDNLDHAVQEMRRLGVRRLPVVGAMGQLVGVMALDDVLEVLAGELQSLSGALRTERAVESALRP